MKIPKQAYTTELMELAVKQVKDAQSISAVIKELGLSNQALRNWIKASVEDRAQRCWRKSRHARGNGAVQIAC